MKLKAITWTDSTFLDLCKSIPIEGFLEIGAADASASIILSKRGIPSVAVEANPFTYETFTKASRTEGVKSINVGVGEKAGRADFFIPDSGKTDASSSLRRKLTPEDVTPVEITIVTLSDLVLDNFPTTSCLGLWLDCEGMTYEILNGARSILDRFVVMKLELEIDLIWDSQREAVETLQILDEFGFIPVFCLPEPDGKPRDWIFVHRTKLETVENVIRKEFKAAIKSRVKVLDWKPFVTINTLKRACKGLLLKIFRNSIVIHKLIAFFGSISSTNLLRDSRNSQSNL